jgi:hypothetical protein
VNRRAGFSVGLPPGWVARGTGGSTLVRSGDRRLAISISADRSIDGRRLAPGAYARRTLRGLVGYGRLRVGRPRPVPGARYPAASVSARGTFRPRRLRQAIRAVAMRRRRQVTYALMFFRSASAPAGLYAPAVAGMIRSFRAQPPEF